MKSSDTAVSRSPMEQELRRDVRTFTALALAIALMLTISTCHYHGSLDSDIGLTVTSLDLSKAEEMDSSENRPDLSARNNSIAANGHYISGVSQHTYEATGAEPPSISIFGRRSSDNTLVWATQITANDFMSSLTEETNASSSSERPSTIETTNLLNPWILSPDGKHVAFELNSSSKSVTYFAVVDTSSGEVVQTTHVTRRIIGVALTDTHLAVETSDQPFPGGGGNATLTVVSLSQHETSPTTLPTTQWLIGSSHRSFLMTVSLQNDSCTESSCPPRTVSRIDGRGRTIDTVTGVTYTYSGGWIVRYSDPTSASSLFNQTYGRADQQERDTARTQLAGTRRELVDPDSGQRTDVTDLLTIEVGLPTGPGLLAVRATPSDDGKTEYVPVFWLSSTDDGHPHTENLEQFEIK